MSRKIASLLAVGIVPLLLGLSTPLSFANGPRYSVVINNAPGVPQDIWVAASSASGTWKGGGSVCVVGGVIYAMAKVTGEELPPDFNPDTVQLIIVVKEPINGGRGGPGPFWADDNFFFEGAFETPVVHGLGFFPPEVAAIFQYITIYRLTFNYVEGRSLQDVMVWMYLNLPPAMGGPMWVPDTPEFPRLLMTVINTLG